MSSYTAATARRAVTLKDVAAAAGVSTAAVSRAFTPGAPVSDDMRKRVQAVATTLGYRPNRLAAGLASGRTGLVGLVVDDFANPALPRALDAFSQSLQEAGYRPILLNLAGRSSADHAADLVHDYGLEALVLLSPTLPQHYVRAFYRSGLPVVQAFHYAGHNPAISQAGVRDAEAGRLAALTFRDRGYTRFAYIGGPSSGPDGSPPARDPGAGFVRMSGRLGFDVVTAEAAAWTYDAGMAAAQTLAETTDCDAYFCASDLLAIGAMMALRQGRLRIPQDVGLLGMDDIPMADWHGIKLSSIALPTEDIARTCTAVIAALRGVPDAEPVTHMFECRLVERRTLRRAP